jgi:amino acid transporter
LAKYNLKEGFIVPEEKKLSLLEATFINLNIMVSTGIFINTIILSKMTGAACFLLYPIIGIIMLPLIACIGKLLNMYPSGGFYAFAQDIHPFLGFLSCWSYFFGKLASGTLMLYVSIIFMQQLISPISQVSPIYISLLLLILFAYLNLLHMKVGTTIQKFFLVAKFIPIVFVIIAGILLFDTSNITPASFIWDGVPTSIPLILYCLAGFEAACSLSRKIENASVNAPKAVYFSFGSIMFLYALFQGFIYMITQTSLPNLSGYQDAFPFITTQFFNSPWIAHKASLILSFAIGSSALGGSYGILFSNPWNLYTLAEHNHLFFSQNIIKLNKHHIPTLAIIIETATSALFLIFTQGNQVPLQQTASFGVTLAYTISIFSYCYFMFHKSLTHKIIGLFAFGTSLLFIAGCVNSFMDTGIKPLLLFIAILIFGSIMFTYQQQK